MELIRATKISKQFGGRKVVNELSMDIRQGEILAMIGANGAGKSTTLAMLLGIETPDEGEVVRWRQDYRAHVGVQLQATPFFEGYTAEENLRLFAALYRTPLGPQQIADTLQRCGLGQAGTTRAARLSGGQQKRLAIAVTTIHQPDLIVLDEPAAGLDPRARHEVRTMIKQLAKAGTAVLFTSHDMEEVARIADRMVVLHGGHIAAQGAPAELLAQSGCATLDEFYFELTDKEEEMAQ